MGNINGDECAKIIYPSNKVKLQCTSMRDAAKLFGGDRKLEGFFAIDVKSRRDKWRIILQPLDENECPLSHVILMS